MATTKTKSQLIDLRPAEEQIEEVKQYVQKNFGFLSAFINPIWWQPEAEDGCAFECRGKYYTVENGVLAITSQEEIEKKLGN